MSFAARLLAWFAEHGRHDLPWQHPRSAYRVWVSEIMLQQTTVQAVIPYFERFVARFPDIESLAQAPLDEVLSLWAGLGYYARARNLHKAAGVVLDRFGGDFPQEFEQVLSLPGIGRSTAGAILAQAYGLRHPILDGNAKRVLARHAGIDGWPGRTAVLKSLWDVAETHTPDAQLVDYSQAIMDLGAHVCRRRTPDCAHCPVAQDCVARQQQRQSELPASAPRRQRPRRETRMLICLDDAGQVLLQRRPDRGIWGGLWSLPELEVGQNLVEICQQRLGLSALEVHDMPPLIHNFTHFELRILPQLVRTRPLAIMDADDLAWYKIAPDMVPGMPAPVTTLLSRVET